MTAVLGIAQGAGPSGEVRMGSFAGTKPLGSEVRILDWNIDRGTRLDGVSKLIEESHPDICLLQEVDRNASRSGYRDIAEVLAKTVHMNFVYADAFLELGQQSGRGPATQGQASLTTFPVRSARVLRFQRQTKFWQPHPLVPNWGILQRRLGGRIALVTELGAEKTGLVVYDLHLESRGIGATRLGQLREVLADARQYGPEVTVVIGGHLNTKYRPGLFQSKLAAEGFRNCFGDRHVRTHVLYGALDWIFVRGHSRCEDTRVIRGSKASDHDPILTTIYLR